MLIKREILFLPLPVNITTSLSVALTDFFINARASSRNFVVCDEQTLFSLCVLPYLQIISK
jgi:hypothetical protein